MKASLNPRGPSRKAKYSLATDSAPVARAKDEKNPDKGRNVNLKPHAYKRSELYGELPALGFCESWQLAVAVGSGSRQKAVKAKRLFLLPGDCRCQLPLPPATASC